MFDLPHLVWVLLVIWAVWYGLRWLKRLPRDPGSQSSAQSSPRPGMRRDARPGTPPRIEAEDLIACQVCGAYVAAGAPDCGRRGCPRPR